MPRPRPLAPLEELGAKVVAALDDDAGVRARAMASARRQLLQQGFPSAMPRWHIGQRSAMALAALFLLAIVGVVVLRRPGALEFKVDGTSGVAQTWLAAPGSRPVIVSFSDGTVLRVGPSSRARVVGLDPQGADIALESGQIHARVVHGAHSAWRLSAGPFAIRVTGTRFDVGWEPVAQTFSLAVLEGSVVVSGSIVGNERLVSAGEKLLASVPQGRLNVVNAETAASGAAATDSDHREPIQNENAAVPAASATETPAALAPATVTRQASDQDAWRVLAKNGELRQAFAAAEARGFEGICASATSSELLILGDAARLSGRSDRATEALLALRRRYPRDPRGAAAAFALGKVAFDQQHAYGQAAEWFAVCLHEQPDGPLARESSGREIEALRNAGDVPGAQQAARNYLARYPEGPHAGVARALLK